MKENYIEIVELIAKALSNNPDDVVVRKTEDDLGTLLSLTVNESDAGKIIGKAGATAKAMRQIVRSIGTKSNIRVSLKILDSRE